MHNKEFVEGGFTPRQTLYCVFVLAERMVETLRCAGRTRGEAQGDAPSDADESESKEDDFPQDG